MSEVKFQGQMTEADLREISRISLPKVFKVFLIAPLLVGLANAVLNWGYYVQPMERVGALLVPFAWPLLFAGVMFFSVRNAWKSNKVLHQPVTGSVSDEGISWNAGEVMRTQYPWSMLLHYRESASTVLVYQSVNQVLYLPRRFFATEEDWISFRQIVSRRLPRK